MRMTTVVGLFLCMFLTGCDAIKGKVEELKAKMQKGGAETSQEVDPSTPFKPCANGSRPEVLKGNCEGSWQVTKKTDGTSQCDFNWGPTIKCGEGKKGLEYEAVCYGTTSKPSAKDIHEPKDCQAKYGEFPQSAAYELSCCPI